MLTQDIEDYDRVVLRARSTCDLPAEEATGWCRAMPANEQAGSLARKPLRSSHHHFQLPTQR
jgi:hypothetical protein